MRATTWASAVFTAGVLVGFAAPGSALALAPGSTSLISRTDGFAPTTSLVNDSLLVPLAIGVVAPIGNGNDAPEGAPRVVSANNRFVVFLSRSDGLAADDDDTVLNAYVHDRVADTTTLVSRADGVSGAGSTTNTGRIALSSNGTYVAFESDAPGLTVNATPPGTTQIYMRDLAAGTTTLVSRGSNLAPAANADALAPAVDDLGDVAFESHATNLGSASGTSQVYLRRSATLAILSRHSGVAPSNAPGDDDSTQAALSADGSTAAFTSKASNLINGVTKGAETNVYTRKPNPASLDDGTDAMADRTPSGSGNKAAGGASLSADGSKIAFASYATNLNSGDAADKLSDIYVRTMASFVTDIPLATVDSGSVKSDENADGASLDATGTHVAFTTRATLAAADKSNSPDLYVRNLSLGTTSFASGPPSGVTNPASVTAGAIAPDGGHAVFSTAARGYTFDGDDDVQRVLFKTLGFVVGPSLSLASRGAGTAPFVAHSGGSYLSSSNRGTGRSPSAISARGRFVAFTSSSDGLSTDDDDRFANTYVRDEALGTTTLVSRADGLAGAGASADSGGRLPAFVQQIGNGLPALPTPFIISDPPSISADGHRVAFVTTASNLLPGDSDDSEDVFVRDLVTGTTTLVSGKADGSFSGGDAASPSISADGTKVAFITAAQLSPDDTNIRADVYVRDLAANTLTLASRATGPSGAVADHRADSVVLSGDGSTVAFETAATNLAQAGATDATLGFDIYVRNLGTQTTTLASSSDALVAGDEQSSQPSLSADGRTVAFISFATNFVTGDANGLAKSDVFVRDLAAGHTMRVSEAGGVGGDEASVSPSVSADGTRIAYLTPSTNLVAGAPTGGVLMLDRAAGATTLLSRADGAAGAAMVTRNGLSLSPDGHCVAFGSSDASVTPSSPASSDFSRVYLRAIDAPCAEIPPTPTPTPTPTDAGVGGNPSATPTPQVVDRTAPVLSGVKLTPKRFRVLAAGTKPARAKGRGTRIALRSSEAAKLVLTVGKTAPGKRSGKACVKATKRLRKAKACTRFTPVGTIRQSIPAGATTIKFAGRFGSKRLRPGAYAVQLVATDAAGNASKVVTSAFTIRAG